MLTNTSYEILQEQLLIKISSLFYTNFLTENSTHKTHWDNEDIALHLLAE